MAILEYKCPNCGGAISFDADSQQLVCPYCESVIDMQALHAASEETSEEPEAIDWGYEGAGWRDGEQDGMAVYSCKSCGGEIVGEETLGSTSCPFCGNQVVITSKFSGTLRPDLIIPFKLNKDAAVSALKKHYLGKRLLPKAFKDQNHLNEIKGVYVPFWLFDAEADAQITYRATQTRKWSDTKYDYIETSHYRVYREGTIGFNRIPVDGSEAIDDTLMESVEPFEYKDAVDFQPAFLAGYFANKYDVDADQSIGRANERVTASATSAFAETVTGYDTVTPERKNIRLTSGGVQYALLPVWLLSTAWNGQNFVFAMNGQTGELVGDLPLDKKLYRSWLIKLFAIPAVALNVIVQIVMSL